MILSKKILHLGKTKTNYFPKYDVHYNPIITAQSILLKNEDLEILQNITHIVVTSKETITHFLKPYREKLSDKVKILSIGPFTTESLKKENFNVFCQAYDYSQEGIINVFENLKEAEMYVGLPRSTLARTNLEGYLNKKNIKNRVFDCYNTILNKNFSKVNLDDYQGIFFTSPSCVDFFFEIYSVIPCQIIFYAIGAITEKYLFYKKKEFKLLNNIIKLIVNK